LRAASALLTGIDACLRAHHRARDLTKLGQGAPNSLICSQSSSRPRRSGCLRSPQIFGSIAQQIQEFELQIKAIEAELLARIAGTM
jgi:hypothetical protein